MDRMAWGENCVLRGDVREGPLALAEFAADLNPVRTGEAASVYGLPNLFFDRTYVTENLQRLVRDVLQRLAGRGGTPVIRVQVAYGGGKTHALIALLHLAEGGDGLEAHPSVQAFMGFSGLNRLPKARVALLPFDKFGVVEGFSAVAPDGSQKRVKTPWGALAYQLAGTDGLDKLSEHEERNIPPAEELLVELLGAPKESDLSTLILMDETLMYIRGAVTADRERLPILQDFFQTLTQAVRSVEGAALVASIISSDMVADDRTSIECMNVLNQVFRRVEETTEPVTGDDIPELLRRRLFESVDTGNQRRAIVDRLATAMQRLPLRASRWNQSAKERLLESYPFHPDLLEVFYQKWTGLSTFHRTRGVLRMFAIALRDAEGRDASAFVGAGALLGSDGELSEAVRELIETCDEGNQWTPILSGELDRARGIQEEHPLLRRHREVEQTVIATFLHSQPSGQKAEESDLYGLLAHAEIDPLSVEDGLVKWRESSWFLRENDRSWSLGTVPNLTKMHFEAMRSVSAEQINAELLQRIKTVKLGQTGDNIAVHARPDSPNDISDNADFHFVIAAPDLTATAGEEVSDSLKSYFARTYKNHVIILAPDQARLARVRHSIRNVLAWQAIENGDEMDSLSDSQKTQLSQRKREDEHSISDSVKSAYSVLIALDEDGKVEARQLTGTEPAFERVKAFLEEEERLLTTSLDPDLLQLGSYLELWSDDETSKPVQGLYGMFASLPRLPKLLSRQVFLDTLRRGVAEGKIVLRDVRGDGSQNTYWRRAPDDELLWQRGAEIVPVEHAELYRLEPELLRPKAIPELWEDDAFPLKVSAILECFNGEEAPKLASDAILFGAVKSAIEARFVMGRHRGEDYIGEDVINSIIDADWEVLPSPAPIRGSELTPHSLPEAWEDGTSTVGKVTAELAEQRGAIPSWVLIKVAVDQGVSARLFEITTDNWPCAVHEADRVGLRVSEEPMRLEPGEIAAVIPATSGSVALGWIKEKLESTKDIPIPDDVFRDAVNEALNRKLIVSDGQPVDDYYQTRVREPDWVRHSESRLTETQIQDFAERIGNLSEIAPELEFQFRLSISTEGDRPSDEVFEELNEVLGEVAESLKFGSDGS